MSDNNKNNIKHFYAKKMGAFLLCFSVLFFAGGYFYGTNSLDLESLIYSVKQIFLPAVIMGGFGYIIGMLLDAANKKSSKKVEKKVKY